MSDESHAMKVSVRLDELELLVLAEVIAAMPSHDEAGNLVAIGPADALRHALHEHAKTLTKTRGRK